MFNFIYEIILMIAFFATFKLFDIYVATVVIIVGALIQVIGTRLWLQRFDKKQLIVLFILMIFGGLTLYFHNPIFIKWKPTVLFWLIGTVFLVSPFFSREPLTKLMMGRALEGKQPIPALIWKRLNYAWGIFFILLGSTNLGIAYYCTTDTWVNFKVYGILSALILFGIIQSFYLSRYMTDAVRSE